MTSSRIEKMNGIHQPQVLNSFDPIAASHAMTTSSEKKNTGKKNDGGAELHAWDD